MQSLRKPHLDAVRRIMRYVKATTHYGLFYAHGKELDVHGYTDADWAGSSYVTGDLLVVMLSLLGVQWWG